MHYSCKKINSVWRGHYIVMFTSVFWNQYNPIVMNGGAETVYLCVAVPVYQRGGYVLAGVRCGHTRLAHGICCVVTLRLPACNVMYLVTLKYLSHMSTS